MANFTSFDKLLEAMSKIADSSDSKLKYDKTVIMEIVKLLDAETGRYAVKYQGNTLEAFAAKTDDKYDTGDSVYVKIPEGDFTNTKIIEGKVNNKTSDEQERNTISNTIVDIEPSWFSENVYGALEGQPYELISGGETTNILAWDRRIENPQYSMADTLLKTYNKEYDKFIIKASFMTSFLGAHTTGNYGLKLILKLVDVEGKEDYIKQTYVLDTTSFTGNVYQLSSYSPQYAVFQIPKNSFLGVESLSFFQDGMEKDIWKRADGESGEEITTPNIFVKDISVNFVDILDYTQDKYFVFLDTPRGNTFTKKTDQDIIVSPRLLYKGENLISDSSCEVQWFKENPNIQVNSPLYVAAVGCGWQPVDVEDKILTIKKNDVIIEKRYKALITYGSKKSLFTKIITIYNTDNAYKKVNILRDTVGNKTYLYIENQKYKGTWYRELPDGSYIGLTSGVDENPWAVTVFEGKYEYAESDIEHKNPIEIKNKELTAYNKIDISEWLSYNTVTFYCNIYENQNKFLTTKNYTITRLDEDSDVTVNFVGENVYHYDANGDIAIEESEKDRTIDGKITWREGLGTAFKVEWFDTLGNQIETGTTGTRLDNSMLRDVYVDGNNVLHYKISSKYYNYYTNNNFRMKITTITGKEYTFSCDIIFAKDGEPGTNGTTYITMIRPIDKNGDLDTNYKALSASNLGQRFKAYVYKDGKEITTNDDYIIAYEWSEENIPFDGENVKDENGKYPNRLKQTIQISSLPAAPVEKMDKKPVLGPNGEDTGETEDVPTGVYNIKGYVLKVAVTITDKTTNNRRRVITYYNLPIAVAFGNNFDSQLFNTNIPNFIQYNSDGTTASYTYTELTGNYGETFLDFGKSISYAKDAIDIESNEKKYYLKPVNNYYYQSGSAAISLVLNKNLYVVYTIMMYRNAFGNATINGWDGTQLKLDESGNYLLAAMVGAGRKEDDNTFTGVVMGTVSDGKNESDGLFGYNKGIRTFELESKTGNAYFGSNREITINSSQATIEGNCKGNEDKRMILKLVADKDEEGNIDNGTHAIDIGNKTFYVDYNGSLTATSAYINGEIHSEKGEIGGWTITKDSIYANHGESNLTTIISSTDGIQTEHIALGSNFEWGTDANKKFKLKPRGYIGNMTINDALNKEKEEALGISSTYSFAIRTSADDLDSSGRGAYLKVLSSGYVDLGPSVVLGSSTGQLICNIPLSGQKDAKIYARFA